MGRCSPRGALGRGAAGVGRGAALGAAELLGACFEWRACLVHAARYLEEPVADTGNAFTDLTFLVRRAVRELNEPSLLEPIAAKVPERFHAMRDATLLKDLVLPWLQPGPANRAAYDARVEATRGERRFEGRPGDFAAHCFALARICKVEDELLRLWSEEDGWGWWDLAVDAARVQARRGEAASAWATVWSWAPRWRPMDALQTFPLVLLTDPWLSPLLTAERAKELLALPRGG